MSARLDAVSKSKQAYVVARTTLENRLREQLREELSNMQTQIDVAVRYAYDAGESKAAILRALGTKDYHTLNACLERTRGVTEVVGLDTVYRREGDVLHVTYVDHGPMTITAGAEFSVQILNGTLTFNPLTPLYSEDWSERNEAVAQLSTIDSWYYQEAADWWRNAV